MPFIRAFRLRRAEYFADFVITPPMTLILALWSLRQGFGLLWIGLFASGLSVWTLYEYVVHRLSHHVPGLVDIHRLHHRNTKDYIGLHPALTVAIYGLIWLVFGFHAAPFAVGFSTGYVIYAALHSAFHYSQILPGHILFGMKQRHVTHHRFHDRCYGVTSGLWDRFFGTN